jgi:hypothetical protein
MLKGGLMLHSTADPHTTKNCTLWDHWEDYTPTQKANLKQFAMASFDALQVIHCLSFRFIFLILSQALVFLDLENRPECCGQQPAFTIVVIQAWAGQWLDSSKPA